LNWQDLNFGDLMKTKKINCARILWFGEEVPALEEGFQLLKLPIILP
jgi:hypothetical protein